MLYVKKFGQYGLHKNNDLSTSKISVYEKMGDAFILRCKIKGTKTNKRFMFYQKALDKKIGKQAKRELEYYERIANTLIKYLTEQGAVATYME